MVLKAESNSSASGLFKKTSVDLQEYPYLNWSWRIENRLATNSKELKSDDDYGARVYVVIDPGVAGLEDKGGKLCVGGEPSR